MNKLIIGIIVGVSIISTLCVVVIVAVTLGVVLSKDDSSGDVPINFKSVVNNPYMVNELDTFEIISRTKFSGEKPKIMKMKYTKYPYWATTEKFTTDEKTAIIEENTRIWADLPTMINNGSYGRMSPELGGEKQFEATGVNWEADRVTIKYGIMGKLTGMRLVGWVFPGELFTVTVPQDLNIGEKNLQLCVGKCSSSAGNHWLNVAKFSNNRMPLDSYQFPLKESLLDKNRQYKLGSPFGGGVYVWTNDNVKNWNPFFLTFSNLGLAPRINYGETTNKQWNEELRNAPGNVAEIRAPGVRLIMTARNVREVEDAEFVGTWWHEAISVGNTFTFYPLPISMMFDERVDAGAAVAFVGAWFCQIPNSWAASTVNKQAMITQLNWGTLHEMNHHMEGTYARDGKWGMGASETNNNVINALFHIDYNNIAAKRNKGLTDWEYITDGYSTMKTVFDNSQNSIYLRTYVTPAFGFGTIAVSNLINNYYNMYYNEKYDTTFGKSRTDSGIFCLLLARAIERDTQYYCNIFKWAIDTKILAEIKKYKYPTFFPFFMSYSHTYNGNKYGRTYTLPYNITTRLNFTASTAMDKATKNIKFEIVEGLTKGNLKKIEENVYDYTPTYKPSDGDTFKIKFTFNANGENGEIIYEGEFVTENKARRGYGYKVVSETKLNNMSDVEAIMKGRDMSNYDYTRNSNAMQINNYNDKVDNVDTPTFNTVEGTFIVPDEGYYTLFAKTDEMGSLDMQMEDGKYTRFATVNKYISGYQKNLEGSYKTALLKANYPYNYILQNYNAGGQGGITIGYCYHGTKESEVNISSCSIKDVPATYVYAKGLGPQDVQKEYVYPPIKYSRQIRYLNYKMVTSPQCIKDDCSVECFQLPPPGSSSDVCNNIFDRSDSTYYHSAWTGSGTTFPTTFFFHFNKTVYFNSMELRMRRWQDTFGNFTIYCGKVEEQLDKIMTVEKSNSNPRTLTFTEIQRCNYIKFEVLNNANGYNYVNLGDLLLYIEQKYTNLFKPTHPDVRSTGFVARNAPGHYENVLFENTEDGKGQITFQMVGKRFGLFGDYDSSFGKLEVLVDGKDPVFYKQIDTKSSILRTLYLACSFEEGTHIVTINVKEGRVNLDVIGFD
ncbi:antigenic protein P1, putative [Entamoeba invadens IP1]|uniref:Antigenic protein P1, putative n=1 Tax=Entamoeba invadens IP1 TaxID=370355 RepID=L7FM50_ENTIV|nr:antigenic protein P1, putative [Entamoeba invadens IP1]ELP88616.1 antigenic protein P1, putative [Entamoeba invadens IP1]|eukprot:XP_004255387.1 antigenic protein P1, putative [Entamoeba invadens IP1]